MQLLFAAGAKPLLLCCRAAAAAAARVCAFARTDDNTNLPIQIARYPSVDLIARLPYFVFFEGKSQT